MTLSIIAAMTNRLVIGKDNDMPWNLPADLKHFKETTMNKPVIMGRKTFESIGKALPKRRNVVITSKKDLKLSGCDVVNSLEEALKLVKDEKEVFIIGGSNIYKQALPLADKLYITYIEADIQGDKYFPSFADTQLEEITSVRRQSDDKNEYNLKFVEYKVIK